MIYFKVCSPLKLRSGLTGNYHATYYYSCNLPLYAIPQIKSSKIEEWENINFYRFY